MEQTIIGKEGKISKVLLNNKNLEEHLNDETSKITSKNKVASRLPLLQSLIIEQYDIDYVSHKRYNHSHLGIAKSFQKLLEQTKNQQRQQAKHLE